MLGGGSAGGDNNKERNQHAHRPIQRNPLRDLCNFDIHNDMKISKKNKETIAQIPAELIIRTESLKKALQDYPKDGGILIQAYEELVMETPARGRVLCGVSLCITVRKTLE